MTPMTKVRMLVGLSGPTFYVEPGQAYECDDSEAARLICARYALPWTDEIETAVIEPAAETRPAIKRKRTK